MVHLALGPGALREDLADGETKPARRVWTTSSSSGTVLDMTEQEQAQAQGEQDAAIALAEEDHWRIVGCRMLTVHPVEEWVPRAHRRANLDGAASVLGYRPLVMA